MNFALDNLFGCFFLQALNRVDLLCVCFVCVKSSVPASLDCIASESSTSSTFTVSEYMDGAGDGDGDGCTGDGMRAFVIGVDDSSGGGRSKGAGGGGI